MKCIQILLITFYILILFPHYNSNERVDETSIPPLPASRSASNSKVVVVLEMEA